MSKTDTIAEPQQARLPWAEAAADDPAERIAALKRQEGFLQGRSIYCEACSTDFLLDGAQTGGQCPLCRESIAWSGSPRMLVRPFAVAAPGTSRRQVLDKLRHWCRRSLLAPSRLKRRLLEDRSLSQILFPYWIFDCQSTTRYSGTCWDSRGARPKSGVVKRVFRDLLVPAGRSLDSELRQKLTPIPLGRLEGFDETGWGEAHLECYRLEPETAFKGVVDRISPVIEGDLREAVGGSKPLIESASIQFDTIAVKLLLFPCWVSACTFQGRVYRVWADAQTGEIHGKLPKSPVKIGLLAGLLLAAAAALTVWLG